jgi:cytochrome c oxidase subunit 2
MSVQQGQSDATGQNIAMAVAGFIMAGTIIGAGIGGFALGRQVMPAASSAPATVATASQAPTAASSAQNVAITIASNSATPGVYQFSPAAISVRAGHKVRLTFTNPGMAMHGISIPAYDVNTMIQPASGGHASTTQASFTPTKPGVYVLHCTVYCGSGHTSMALRLTVLA